MTADYTLHGCDDAEEALRSLLMWRREHPEWLTGKRHRSGLVINYTTTGSHWKAYAIWRTKTGWHIAQDHPVRPPEEC